ncbi:MAG: hypothetical protein IJS96_05635 [Schwartzia sp.]|nr:hypothetical protein [Schwartzia sp. (in: firmicutes)]
MKGWTKRILLPALLCGVLLLGAGGPTEASAAPPGGETTVSEASAWTRFRDSLLGRHRHRHHHRYARYHHAPPPRHHHHHRHRATESGSLPLYSDDLS